MPPAQRRPAANDAGSITDVAGIRVGHWTDRRRATGCSVVLAPHGTVAGFHGAGGAPGTIDTHLLRPENTVQEVHAVLISGGSAHGLAAAAGVRAALREQGAGLPVIPDAAPVPIVVGAVCFDLGIGRADAYPGEAQGRLAVRRATAGRVAEGSVGAGTGCTVGSLLGRDRALKGGIGTASARHESGLIVGALVTVNAVADVVDPESGDLLAGPRGVRRGEMRRSADALLEKPMAAYLADAAAARDALGGANPLGNTTIAVVATNARLHKAQATRLAIMADDGIAHAVRPAHTPADGDSVFVLATGRYDAPLHDAPVLLTLLGSMAARMVARAIVRAVQRAEGLAGVPAGHEWRRRRSGP